MAKEKVIAGLDVGNSRIRTVVGIVNPDSTSPNIIGVGSVAAKGIRKGSVIDPEELTASITASLEEAERMSGEPIHSVFTNIGGTGLTTKLVEGVVAISGSEITESDVSRVLESAQSTLTTANHSVLKIIPKAFTVDNQEGVKYPVGMRGVRLAVEAFAISAPNQNIENLEKSINQAGSDIDDLVPTPLAAAESVLDKRQRELGVVVINIGAAETSVIVYEEGMLIHTAVLPIGGESITNDLAIGLRTAVDTAEKVKIEHGNANISSLSDYDTIDLSLISKSEDQQVSKRKIGQIVKARIEEIFEYVNQELLSIDRAGKLPAGAILTGNGSKVPGTSDIARDVLKLPVAIGFPIEVDGIVDKIDDPAYATAVGLVVWGSKNDSGSGFSFPKLNINLGGFGGKVMDFFKNFIPKK